MRIVLTDRDLGNDTFPSDVKIVKITYKTLDDYNNNDDVIAIVGSRAMAIKANKMNLSNLKLFQLTSAGFDNVPLDEYRKKNIFVSNAGSIYSDPIAETVVYGMLMIAKKYWKNPNWHFFRPMRKYKYITELSNKKVMILGAGNIGTAVARRLSGFNMLIYGYDPYCIEKKEYIEIFRNKEELAKKINDIDFLISTLPENDQTKNFIDHSLLNLMKNDAVIINVGRNTVFNSDDLYISLKSKKIKGAVLDMFQTIPNPFTNKFRRLNNVIVLPGVSAISQELNIRLRNLIEKNIVLIYENKEPNFVVNMKGEIV